jgi:hypothetical protein
MRAARASRAGGCAAGVAARPRELIDGEKLTHLSSSRAVKSSLRAGLASALGLLATACVGTRNLSDPMVVVRSLASGASGRTELGVSTEYGIVFLGRTGRSGEVEVTVWFGDGPSIEYAVAEPVGGELFMAEAEIRLPVARMSFDTPRPGDELVVMGRRGAELWQETVRVAADPRVEGLLLEWNERIARDADQVGAGIFLPEWEEQPRLVGLVSGTLTLTGADGQQRRYLTAIGPDELWPLVTYKRDHSLKPRWVYREDIL